MTGNIQNRSPPTDGSSDYEIPADNVSHSLLSKDSFSHTWVIDCFKECTEECGQYFYSAVFVCKRKWRLQLYPRGQASDPDWVSVYLKSENDEPITATFSFKAFNYIDGNRHYIEKCRSSHHTCKFPPRQSLGFKQFVSRELVQDTLIITVNISVLGNRTVSASPSDATSQQKAVTSLVSDISACLGDNDTADVKIQIATKADPADPAQLFKAHRTVLAARSPVFRAMFTANMKERTSDTIVIDDIPADVFRVLLQYIYTAEISNMPDMAADLYAAADKYQIDALKQQCVRVITSNIAVHNVCEVLVLADLHNDEELKKTAFSFIHAHSAEVRATEGFKQLLRLPSMRVFAEMIVAFSDNHDNT